MLPLVLGRLSRLPTGSLQEVAVSETEHFDLQWTATLDHLLLAICAKSP
jgi:hypothetical protein